MFVGFSRLLATHLSPFDVGDFYPSITEDLLLKALNYASRFTTITQQDRHIITHGKKSLLQQQNPPWTKKNTKDMFNVTMGSYHGLYRDDGLASLRASSPIWASEGSLARTRERASGQAARGRGKESLQRSLIKFHLYFAQTKGNTIG